MFDILHEGCITNETFSSGVRSTMGSRYLNAQFRGFHVNATILAKLVVTISLEENKNFRSRGLQLDSWKTRATVNI